MIKDISKYVIKNMVMNLTRSSLTILSILMGIMAIFAILSFGQGLTNYVNSLAEDMGTQNLIVQPRGAGPPGNTGTALTEDDIDFLQNQRGVEDATGLVMKNAEVKKNQDSDGKYIYAMGINTDPDKIRFANKVLSSFEIKEGRLLDTGDQKTAVLGHNYMESDRVFKTPLELRDRIYINGVRFEVVGFFEKTGNPQDDSSVTIPKEDAEDLFDLEDKYQMIYLRAEKGVNPSTLADTLTEKLRRDKGQDEGQEDFTIETLESQLETFNQTITLLNGVLVLIAAISILVAAVNIANTMYTTVLERTKEIGIMKAIGAKNSYIITIFVMEAALLGLIGGGIGVGLGYIIASIGGNIASSFGYDLLQPAFPAALIIGCILFGGLVGTISGFIPAKQASGFKPVDTLREE